MFFPKAMTEIELIVPAKDLLAVTKVLSGRGVFHQTDSNYLGAAEAGGTVNWQEKAAAYASLERRIQVLMQTLTVYEGSHPSTEFEAMADLEKIRPAIEQIEVEVKGVTDQLAGERKRLEQLQNNLHQLEPIEDIDLDISTLHKSRYLYSVLGQIPTANLDRLQTSLVRIPYVFLTLRSDSTKPVVWLAGTQSHADVLERAARSAYLNPLVLPEGYKGAPAQIIDHLRNEITNANKTIVELTADIARLAEARGGQLRSLLWEMHTSRVLTDAIVRFGQLRYTYVITGWTPSDNLHDLTQHLHFASKEILIETLPSKRGGHNAHVPVELTNSAFLRPFQLLVNTYARPRYGELDPTILIAITFPLLFGAMFGDIGQGLVLAVLGYLMASKKVKALSSMSSLGGVVALCGASATIFGFLYGSIFGFEDVHILGIELKPLWLSPIHNIMNVLMVAIGAGLILLILGYLVGIFNAYRAQEWGHLFFGHTGIAGFVMYISLLGFGGAAAGILPAPLKTVFVVLAIVAAVAVMFSEALIHWVEGYKPIIDGGIATYLIQAAVELFEVVISMLSNTLSYVRVGAFAVAHGGLSAAIFILAELAGGGGHGVGYWVTIALGNVFIIGFEGLIVGIQTMRLSYYEFFSKFFTGGGMRFEPLSLTPSQEE